MWGLAFLVGTISLIVAGSVSNRTFLLRVVVPFGVLAWAYSYTQHTVAARRAAAGGGGGLEPGTAVRNRRPHRSRVDGPEAAHPALVVDDRLVEVAAAHVGPEGLGEDQLAVGNLP